jgi:predicted transposase/invertase (TIGR01784 family)
MKNIGGIIYYNKAFPLSNSIRYNPSMPVTATFINPFTDYGFKRLFGEEPNKDLLLDFLNELLREQEGEIKELSYMPLENLPRLQGERKAIFDLYCTNENGEKFIVELQKTKQKYFKDRALYYATFPIQEQAQLGKAWDFELKNIYTIAILDFVFDEDTHEPEKYRYDIKLADTDTHQVFYDKLTFIYLEMPKFNKQEHELVTKFDKWMYVLKNLDKLERIPATIQDKIFTKLFNTAAIASLNRQEFDVYQEHLNAYRDIKNSIDTAREEGEEIGKAIGEKKGKTEIARNMLKAGFSVADIMALTGLTVAEIDRLG